MLGAGRDLQRDGALRRRHLDLRPERCVGERHRDLDDEIRAAALVDRRRRDTRDDVQVARRAAGDPASPLPLRRIRVPSLTPAGIFTV